jgi:uncharacterized protein (TIGR02145 family)
MKKHLTLLFLVIFSVCNSFAQTVTIGTQTWTTKNLDVATFRNGDLIPEAKTDEEWKAAGENKQPAWCYYDNDPANGTKYGKLYNWYAVVDYRGLAPAGWHVPTDGEWTVLENSIGYDAGKKMKSSSGWESWNEDITCSNCKTWNAEYRRKKECNVCQDTRVNGKKTFSGNGTNSSGFSGLPGGGRDDSGSFFYVGYGGYWRSASEHGYWRSASETGAWFRSLANDHSNLYRDSFGKSYGFSVRCVKD